MPPPSPIYRAMIAEGGRPKLGNNSQTLGVRKGVDIDVDQNDNVQRPDFKGKNNGVSCAPVAEDLPDFILPKEFGGTNTKTTVWVIELAELGNDLVAEQDGTKHVSIGPAREMPFDEFERAIRATKDKWVEVT